MLVIQTFAMQKSFAPLFATGVNHKSHLSLVSSSVTNRKRVVIHLSCRAVSGKFDANHDHSSSTPESKPRTRSRPQKDKVVESKDESPLPMKSPRKPRRGRKSEADAVEDYVRNSLEKTFVSIREKNPELFEGKENFMKDKVDEKIDSDDNDNDDINDEREKEEVVEEEDPDWPLDADVGWGIRASEYFEKYKIKNVAGEDGVEIDWEGEVDNNWVKEINCLEWESFAFHPSPLIVLIFERYNRPTENWKILKELEKAAKVYWSAKDRLPPRTVKIDINIERDLAYALKVRECPQLLFLRGNRILYREKDFRTADELVHMIAHFYYNAKKPSWMNNTASSPPY